MCTRTRNAASLGILMMGMLASLFASSLSGQVFVFTVRPSITGAARTIGSLAGGHACHAGISFGPVTPYFGLGFIVMPLSGSISEVSWEEDYSSGNLYKYRELEIEASGSASLFLPMIGLRVDLSRSDLVPYLYVDASKAFGNIDAKFKETRRYYDPEGRLTDERVIDEELWDDWIEEDLGIDPDDLYFSVWALSAGFGTEYRLSRRFAIGGEYEVRCYFMRTGFKMDETYTSWRYESDDSLRATLVTSRVAVTLSFRFDASASEDSAKKMEPGPERKKKPRPERKREPEPETESWDAFYE